MDIDRWFAGRPTRRLCDALHPEMKDLSRPEMVCDCGNRMGRDRNATMSHYRGYREERENRGGDAPTPVEIGAARPVAVLPSW